MNLLLLLFVFVLFKTVFSQNESFVNISDGTIQGNVGSVGDLEYRSFLGVPFMKPPIDELRFEPPQPVDPWKPSVLDATKYKSLCPQKCILPASFCPPPFSEDCMYLNIYTPSLSNISLKGPLPVLVYFQGGNFQQSGVNFNGTDAMNFAAVSQTIVVTASYRLGALGYLVTPSSLNGNYGLFDQQQALIWVRDNINAFGGNSQNVTVVGQSAGATSIMVMLTSSYFDGLFHKAIVHSSPTTLPLKPREAASEDGALFLGLIDCAFTDTISCLRSKTVDEILNAQDKINKVPVLNHFWSTFYPWTPNIEGDWVKGQFFDLINAGNYTSMPMMIGDTSDEAQTYIYGLFESEVSDIVYKLLIKYIFHDNSAYEKVLEQYPPNGVDNRQTMENLTADYLFICPNQNISKIWINKDDVYFWDFAEVPSFIDFSAVAPECSDAVCHGSDILFLLGVNLYNLTQDELDVSDYMFKAWGNFAWTSNPNTGPHTLPIAWEKFTSANKEYITLEGPTPVQSNSWRKEYCEFWDETGYIYGTYTDDDDDVTIEEAFDLLILGIIITCVVLLICCLIGGGILFKKSGYTLSSS